MIPLFKVAMQSNIEVDLSTVLHSGYIGQGPKVEEFESCLSTHFKNPFINTVSSATSGLVLALHLCKDGIRDEVISTPLTCTATNSSILQNGLKIKWADINRSDFNIDSEDVIKKLSPRTLAIMAVHWGGYACDLDKLKYAQNVCQGKYGHRPTIIEDCSHCWDAYYKKQMVGNRGNIAVFSFQSIKHLTTGDGGMFISPSNDFHQLVKKTRWYGLDRTSSLSVRSEQNIERWGFKAHMNDIAATIGIGNLPLATENVKKNKANAAYFNEQFKSIPGLTLVQTETDRESSYWIYSMLVENRAGFIRKLNQESIAAEIVHSRNDKHRCFAEFTTELTEMDYVSSRQINIPCGWWVTPDDRDRIVSVIKSGW